MAHKPPFWAPRARRCTWRRDICRIGLVGATLCAIAAATCQTAPCRAQQVPVPIYPGSQGNVLVTQNQSGQQPTFVLPVYRNGPGYSRRSGLQLSVDASWPGDWGYLPVTFTFTAPGPATAAQQITVAFRAGNWMTRGRSIAVESDGELPQGSSQTTVTLIVPKYADWHLHSWDVWIDGARDKELSYTYGGSLRAGNDALAVLAVDEANSNFASKLVNDLQQMMSGAQVSSRIVAQADLPINWLEYTSLDVVALSADSFIKLAQDHPDQTTAVLQWVRSGGNLWLSETGSEWKNLPPIEQIVGGSPFDDGADANLIDPMQLGWIYPSLTERDKEPVEGAVALWGVETAFTNLDQTESRGGRVIGEGNRRPSYGRSPNSGRPRDVATTSGRLALEPSQTYEADSRKWFAVRSHGCGVITAFRGEIELNAASQSPSSLDAVQRTLLQPRLSWETRHGNVPQSENYDFNNLLIPGVGLAPVGMFQLLITLFVIGIGPVNYLLLKRRKKLPLLLVTVPSAAALVTITLFAYGLLTDGFEVRVRARSFATLDQQRGSLTTAGRLSYYAGMAPSDGLLFPEDTAVYPIHAPGRLTTLGRRGDISERTVQWDDGQRLSEGWLASRTPTQLLTIRASQTDKKIDIEADGSKLRVTNRLGVDVTHLAVQDDRGRLFWCTELKIGETAELNEHDRIKALASLREVLQDNEPEFPPGAEDVTNRRGVYGYSLSRGLMEAQLSALASPVLRELGSRTYVAITDTGVEFELGLDNVSDEAGFHVIRGRW